MDRAQRGARHADHRAWQPVSVFTVPLSFRVDHTAWLLALGLLLVLLAAAFTWALIRADIDGPARRGLVAGGGGAAGIFASNLLTLAVAWGLLDLVFVVALLCAADQKWAGARR